MDNFKERNHVAFYNASFLSLVGVSGWGALANGTYYLYLFIGLILLECRSLFFFSLLFGFLFSFYIPFSFSFKACSMNSLFSINKEKEM